MECDAKLARMDQDLESMATDRAQWQYMLTLLLSKRHAVMMTMSDNSEMQKAILCI